MVFLVVSHSLTSSLCRLLLLTLAFAGVAVAAPSNDNFANSIPVFNSNTYTGSNVGATLEGNEPIPAGYTSSNYQATIWYVYTPVAEEWFEVNTVGSAIDTVLAIWTGASLDSLQLVHVNNEATEGKVSRIRFEGLPGTAYYISVAGRNAAARGAVTLNLQLGGNQMISGGLSGISGTSVSTGSVDVTSATAPVTFTVSMSVTADILAGYVRLYAPSGQQVASSSLTKAANLVSGGSNFSGTYNVVITVPRYLAPGTYSIGFEVQNAVSNPSKSDSFGWDQMSSLNGYPNTLTVSNSGAQDTFSQWAYANSLTISATADNDNDGIKNLEEFAFGTDPTTLTTSLFTMSGATLTSVGLPRIYMTGSGSNIRLRVEYVQKTSDISQALGYQVEFSDDLINWTAATNSPTVMATGGGYQAVYVEDQTFLPVKTYRFAHVKVTYVLH